MRERLGDGSASQDIKKLRNRLSQQAFRRRRATLIQELRERAEQNLSNESEVVFKLREENAALRADLAAAHSKLNSLLADVQSLVQSTAPKPSSAATTAREASTSNSEDSPSAAEQAFEPLSEADDAALADNSESVELSIEQNGAAQDRHDESHMIHPTFSSVAEVNSIASCDIMQQLPDIWSLNYQMGPDVYQDALASCQQLGQARGKPWVETNSPFSDHMVFIQQELSAKTEATGAPLSLSLLYLATSSILSLFNTLSRQNAMQWYARTRFRHTRNMTVWKIRPCAETYHRLDPQYQPTLLQLQYSHAAVIDWIPFPSIRDCLIRYHAANPCIDQVISDVVSAYVVETLLSDLVAASPPLKVYIRVVDLVQSMESMDSSCRQEPAKLPTADLSDIFTKSSVSQAVWRHLGIEDGLSRYRLDPELFTQHPEFYDGAGLLLAQGAPLRPESPATLAFPKSLNHETASRYCNFISFTHLDISENFG